MNIFQTYQICRDIKELYKKKSDTPFVSWHWNTIYQIRMPGHGTIIESRRREKHLAYDEFVYANFWTSLIGTAGDFKTIPLTFTVTFYNKDGLLPHAPTESGIAIQGLNARLIYNTMRQEYLKDWHKTLKQQREQSK